MLAMYNEFIPPSFSGETAYRNRSLVILWSLRCMSHLSPFSSTRRFLRTCPQDLEGKKGIKGETHQSVCNIDIDRLPKIVYSEKPGEMISLYMASISQKTPCLIIAQDTQ